MGKKNYWPFHTYFNNYELPKALKEVQNWLLGPGSDKDSKSIPSVGFRRQGEDRYEKVRFKLLNLIADIGYIMPHQGRIFCSINLRSPYLEVSDTDTLTYGFLMLLETYAYGLTVKSDMYIKVTFGYMVFFAAGTDSEKGEDLGSLGRGRYIWCTLNNAIPLTTESGEPLPRKAVSDFISAQVDKFSENYKTALIVGLFINVFYRGFLDPSEFSSFFEKEPLSNDSIFNRIKTTLLTENDVDEAIPKATSLGRTSPKPSSPNFSLPMPRHRAPRPFLVADIETLLLADVHTPYAIGFLAVYPSREIEKNSVRTFFSEEYSHSDFAQRSESMLSDFFVEIEKVVTASNGTLRTIYFHNLGRFDGFFILKHLTKRNKIEYTTKPLIRNNRIYEIRLFLNKKLLFRFRDSLTLLPGSLDQLAITLAPELGRKGSIEHKQLTINDLAQRKDSLLAYLRQDIILLGGVLHRFQEINFSLYRIDIERVMTISALALRVFRSFYYDETSFQISVPTQNEDTFIRKGYYGGHVDVYIPKGENLYHYDVNSLYPYVMMTFPMPEGPPVWRTNLEEEDLSKIFGFVEAVVITPTNIERPFLPYKNKHGTLIYPKGAFIGVYFTEELLYARKLGYQVTPRKGYLFKKKPSPFHNIISDLYKARLEAKKNEDQGRAYYYKIMMNSLYGRFGIKPESHTTEICSHSRYEELLEKDGFMKADMLHDDTFVVSYKSNVFQKSKKGNVGGGSPSTLAAVQIAAAITAYARIYMHPYISRDDCFYTDTDSIVIGSPLPDHLVSSTEIGKFKLENRVKKGYFLAPKSYALIVEEKDSVLKFKGPAKDYITQEWFEKQYKEKGLAKEDITVESLFRIDWATLDVGKKTTHYRLALPENVKRENVYDDSGTWIGTSPQEIVDLGTEGVRTLFKTEALNKKTNTKRKKSKKTQTTPNQKKPPDNS